MSDEDAWDLTDRKYDALWKAWQKREESLDRRAALIAAAVYRSSLRDFGRVRQQDFMPQYGARRPRRLSVEEWKERFEGLVVRTGGRDLRRHERE